MCLISFASNIARIRVEVLCYNGSLRDGNLIDCMGEIKRYFEYENVQYPNQVYFSIMMLEGHAAL